MKKLLSAWPALLVFYLASCATPDDTQSVNQLIESFRSTTAPDKRVAIWILSFENDSLKGETDRLTALDELISELNEQGIQFTNVVKRLPDADLEGKTKAVVTISVANIRSQPRHSAELATQALMGTPLTVLKGDGSWYMVQTPDQYISWVDQAGILLG